MLDLRDVLRYDRSGLHKDYNEWVRQAEEALQISFDVPDRLDYEELVYVGMGGSGTAGDVLADWLSPLWHKPFVVVKDFRLPAFVDKNSLVLLVSFSGETREVLSSLRQAREKEANFVAISSGGTLEKLAIKRGMPHLKVGKAITPRSGFAYLLYASLNVLSKLDLPTQMKAEIVESVKIMRGIYQEVSPNRETRENVAKKAALWLGGGLPVIIASASYRGVATRFKNSLNENAKMPAVTMILPESCHNDLEAITKKSKLILKTVTIMDEAQGAEGHLAQSALTRILGRAGLDSFDVTGRGKGRLSRLVSALYTLEYATLYAAVARKIDPTPTPALKMFREILRSKLPPSIYR